MERTQTKFLPALGALGAVIAATAAYLYTAEGIDAIVCGGVGFIVGGAAPLLRGIWQYLLVFFALAGSFVWLLIHYLK
jgi:hypothetical protein